MVWIELGLVWIEQAGFDLFRAGLVWIEQAGFDLFRARLVWIEMAGFDLTGKAEECSYWPFANI